MLGTQTQKEMVLIFHKGHLATWTILERIDRAHRQRSQLAWTLIDTIASSGAGVEDFANHNNYVKMHENDGSPVENKMGRTIFRQYVSLPTKNRKARNALSQHL